MRLIKAFGPALLATTAALALTAPAAAPAKTIVCHLGASSGHCPGGELPFTGAIAALGEFDLLSGLTNVSCHVALEGAVTSAGGLSSNPKGSIEKAAWSECSSGCGAATVGANKLPWSFEVLGTSTLNLADVDLAHEIWFQACGVKCEYAAGASPELLLNGGFAPALVALGVETTKSTGGLLCPNTVEWDATAALGKTHLSVHRLSGGAILCHLGSGAEHCPSGELPFTGTISATGEFESSSAFGCTLAVEGKISSAGGLTTNPKGSIEKATWSECSQGPCEGGAQVSVGPLGLPWSLELLGTGTLNAGTAHLANLGYWFELCGLKCEYQATASTLELQGGTSASLHALGLTVQKSGGSLICSGQNTWSAALALTPKHLTLHQL